MYSVIGWYLKENTNDRSAKEINNKKQNNQNKRITIVMRRQHHILNNTFSQLLNKYKCGWHSIYRRQRLTMLQKWAKQIERDKERKNKCMCKKKRKN